MYNDRINLNAEVLNEISALLGPICHDVASGYFDDSTVYAGEMASEIERKVIDKLIERYQPTPRDRDVISTVEDRGSIYNIGQLRKAIEGIPDDRMVMPQIVGQDSGVWNVHLQAAWMKEGSKFFILTGSHPDLDHLPGGRNADDRGAVINNLIAELNKLR